jgi:ribokinase
MRRPWRASSGRVRSPPAVRYRVRVVEREARVSSGTVGRRPSVAVVGSMNIDLVTYAPRTPGPGETVIGERFQSGFGGKGANQAVMARLLGAEVAFIGALGDDAYASMTLENFARLGIDAGRVMRVPGSSGVAPIWVEADGTNRIIVVPGANDLLTTDHAASAIGAAVALDVVVGQLEVPQAATAAAFAAAHARRAATVLNPAPAAVLSPALLAATDWLIPNETEFELLAGTVGAPTDGAMAELAARTGCRVVVTLGAAGAALVGADGRVLRLAAERVPVVDTTGAGDAFVGAFAVGLALGVAEQDAVRLGLRCATESVTRPGTQASFPDHVRCAQILGEISGRRGAS